jgi:dTDP-4-dehydrorhamnose reductase
MTDSRDDNREGSKRVVLVTGAGGLLGGCTAELFARRGWHVVARAHSELDISSDQAVQAEIDASRPGLIVNCAASTDVDRCEREPEWAYAINADGPRLLARHAARIDAQIVHVSTDYVFDGTKEGFYTQEDVPNPLSVYAQSKLAGEATVAGETERCYIVRSSWVFGAGGKNFGSRVIEYARSGAKLKGVTDQISIPTYAPDLAARIDKIVRLGSYGLYQVTNTGPTSWYDFARLALDTAGLGQVQMLPATRADLNQAAPRPQNSAMRCLKSEELGLNPLRHWRETLNEFVPLVL